MRRHKRKSNLDSKAKQFGANIKSQIKMIGDCYLSSCLCLSIFQMKINVEITQFYQAKIKFSPVIEQNVD